MEFYKPSILETSPRVSSPFVSSIEGYQGLIEGQDGMDGHDLEWKSRRMATWLVHPRFK